MSVKSIFIIVTVGLSVGVLGSHFYLGSGQRKPASTLPAPKLRLKPWAHSVDGKMNQAIEVKIFAVGGVPNTDEQELTLRAQVKLNQAIDQEVKFQWELPPDASVVSGELEDAWPNLQPGQIATTEITILGVSKESVAKTVTLHVSGAGNGVQYAGAGSFATNSAPHMLSDESSGFMKVQNADLVLKKDEAAAKMDKVHQ